ncbi:MAG TPA: bifunctional demethylmenaquinone methyltransferase/2-methoxy-6-polyprenyl-1,4-benzoquinol methylase UbiE [Methylomirabilota bacterium]|nr:bifunctional demethylmenaquinone methyltransferase/2-methoxy-6-polyprenyl-1,4-benzoquinol methylase UbiE [Methylomirabilota bacterium]
MANTYYEAGERRAARVEDLFATIASRYDLINDLQSFGLHRWWKRRMVRLARPRPGEQALDLCCGTGDVAFRLGRCGVAVTGLDFSGPMLRVARRRKLDSGPSTQPVFFLQADAQALPFADAQFDLATLSYGLRNLASLDRGLEEIRRVLRPGGRVLILDFGKPDRPAWRAVYFAYLRAVVPWFGRIFCGDSAAYAYILESLRHYPGQRGVEERMRALGFVALRTVNLLGGIMSINYGKRAG